MSDRELLELAAKAAEIQIEWTPNYGGAFLTGHPCTVFWRPLTNSGDALDLAVKLRMDIAHFSFGVRANVADHDDCNESNGDDPYAATRRAIVRAAAEIGRTL